MEEKKYSTVVPTEKSTKKKDADGVAVFEEQNGIASSTPNATRRYDQQLDAKGTAKEVPIGGGSSPRHPQVTRPKRPLSAYNLFYMDDRKRLLRALSPDDSTLGADRESQQIEEEDSKRFEVRIKDKSEEQTETPEPDRKRKVGRPRGPNYKPRKKHGAFGFSQLASVVGCDWKSLEQSLKKPYEDQATVQMKRYREAMLEYEKTVEKVKKETNGKYQNESIDPANNDGDKQRSQPSKVAATLDGATAITSHQRTVIRRSRTAPGMHVSFSTPLSPAKSLTSPSQQHLHNVPVASFLVEHNPFSDSSCSEEPDHIMGIS